MDNKENQIAPAEETQMAEVEQGIAAAPETAVAGAQAATSTSGEIARMEIQRRQREAARKEKRKKTLRRVGVIAAIIILILLLLHSCGFTRNVIPGNPGQNDQTMIDGDYSNQDETTIPTVEPTDPKHEHAYTEAITKPTCTEKGFTTFTCECGHSYKSNEVDAYGHDYEKSITKPTCTKEGFTTYKCKRCDHSYVDGKTKATGHKYKETKTAPTCTESGYTTYECKCGETYKGKEIPALGHNYKSVIIAPTTAAQGYTEHTCIRCNDTYKDNYTDKLQEEIPVHTHVYVETVVAPTCTEMGYTIYVCECEHIYSGNETDALGHNYESTVTAPTCTEPGYTTFKCSRCGDTHTGDATEPTGHDYNIVTTAPTCTEDGYSTFTCKHGDHTYVVGGDVALGHNFIGSVTDAPGCETVGTMTHTCDRCGDFYTEEIPEKGHDYTSVVTAPTCTSQGYTEHVCNNCGDSYRDSETDALGHNYIGVVTTEPGCEEPGVKTHTCDRCGDFYTEEVPATGHDYKETIIPPTHESQGYTEHVCNNCGDTYKDGYVDPLVYSNTLTSGYRFNQFVKSDTTSITFTNIAVPEGVETIDVSDDKDGGVLAWFDGTDMYVTTVNGGTLYANEDCSRMFENTQSNPRVVATITFNNFNTSNVTNMRGMFNSAIADRYLTAVDVSGFDTSNVTNMADMFHYRNGITQFNISGFNTSNVTNMSGMFSECYGLKNSDIANFNTAKVTDMSNMFYMISVSELDLSHFDTSNVINMSGMFWNSGMETINLSGWDTSKVTNMSYMFDGTTKLKSLDVTHFDVSKVTNMNCMFSAFGSKMAELDLSTWKPVKLRNAQRMFDGCYVSTIYGQDWTAMVTPTNDSEMFGYCPVLVGAVKYNREYENFDMATPYTGYFTCKPHNYVETIDPPTAAKDGYFVYTCPCGDTYKEKYADALGYSNILMPGEQFNRGFVGEEAKVVFTNSAVPAGVEYYDLSYNQDGGILAWYESIEGTGKFTVYITSVNGEAIKANEDCSNMFNGLPSIKSIDFSNLDTSNVKNMTAMFKGCTGLTELDLTGFNVSKVENMTEMFAGCENLVTIKATNWSRNAEKISDTYFDNEKEDMGENMFLGCEKLVGEMAYDEELTSIALAQCHGYFTYDLPSDHQTADVIVGGYTYRYCSEVGIPYTIRDILTIFYPYEYYF